MYNEQNILNNTLTQADEYLRSRFGEENYEIIAAEDGSSDDTLSLLREAETVFPNLRVAVHPDGKNKGKGAAVRNGILHACGEIIVFTDCDLAYGLEPIAGIAALFERYGNEADIIIGSRNISKDGYEGYTFARKLISKTYLKILKTAAGFRYSDSQSGIKGFRRNAARDIFRRCEIDGFAFDLEAIMIADKLGCKVREMNVKIINHAENTSKIRIVKDTLRMLKDIKKIRKKLRRQ